MFDVKLKERWLTEDAKRRGVDEHILELFLRHSRKRNGFRTCELLSYSLSEAINRGFTWNGSPEGHRFWSEIYEGNSVKPLLSNSTMSMIANVWFIDFKEFE